MLADIVPHVQPRPSEGRPPVRDNKQALRVGVAPGKQPSALPVPLASNRPDAAAIRPSPSLSAAVGRRRAAAAPLDAPPADQANAPGSAAKPAVRVIADRERANGRH